MNLEVSKEDVPPAAGKWPKGRHSMVLALLVLLISSVPRFLLLERDIFPNGVDEGVQIMAGRMWAEGFTLYDQINTVQGPVMLGVYGLVDGDPIMFRYLSAVSSLIILGLVMYLAYKLGGRITMLLAGVFLSMDLMFLHESRLASLDMYCLLAISLGVASIMVYRRNGRWPYALASGGLLGLASMVKLYAVVAAGMVFLIIVLDLISTRVRSGDRDLGRFLPERVNDGGRIGHIIAYSVAGTAVAITVLLIFGPATVIEGILLNQMGRPVDPIGNKVLYLAVFLGANLIALPFFVMGISRAYRSEAGVVLIISMVFLIFMLFQAKTWPHHFLYLSPALALSAGMGGTLLSRRLSRRLPSSNGSTTVPAVILVISLLVIGGFSYAVVARGHPVEYRVADMVRSLTDEGDYVLSGNPRIPVLADRPTPPSIVNVAIVQSPPLTDEFLNETVLEYDVKVIVIAYHLEEFDGFITFVDENYDLRATFHDTHLPFEQDERIYRVYVIKP